jgi:hypothetical protein
MSQARKGDQVRYWARSKSGSPTGTGVVVAEAILGGVDVVWIHGRSGHIPLSNVERIVATPPQRKIAKNPTPRGYHPNTHDRARRFVLMAKMIGGGEQIVATRGTMLDARISLRKHSKALAYLDLWIVDQANGTQYDLKGARTVKRGRVGV